MNYLDAACCQNFFTIVELPNITVGDPRFGKNGTARPK